MYRNNGSEQHERDLFKERSRGQKRTYYFNI